MDLNNATERDNLRGGAGNKSRQSFKQRMQQVSDDHPPTSSPGGFLAGLCGLFCCVLPAAGCGLFCILLVFALSNIVTIATIVIGALYNKESDCPVEKISLLLIVGGSITLVHSLLETISKCVVTLKQRDQDEGTPATSPPGCLTVIMSLLRLASICWFIAACVKVYSISSIVTNDTSSENYCHPVLYLYAFWFVTLSLAIAAFALGLFAILLCCTCCLACFK